MDNRFDTYDRAQRQDDNGAGFMLGLLAGAVIGVGLGMLLAPKSGAEIRERLGEQANDLASTASRQYNRAAGAVSDLAERSRGMYDSARDAVSRGAEEAQRYARDAANATADDRSPATTGFNTPSQAPRS